VTEQCTALKLTGKEVKVMLGEPMGSVLVGTPNQEKHTMVDTAVFIGNLYPNNTLLWLHVTGAQSTQRGVCSKSLPPLTEPSQEQPTNYASSAGGARALSRGQDTESQQLYKLIPGPNLSGAEHKVCAVASINAVKLQKKKKVQ